MTHYLNFLVVCLAVVQCSFAQVQAPPSAVSLVNAGSSSTSRVFVATFSDPNGATDIVGAQFLLNHALNGAGACYVTHVGGVFYLLRNNGVDVDVIGSQPVSNSQCTVSASVVDSGTTRKITISAQLTQAASNKDMGIWLGVQDSIGNNSGWALLGTHRVSAVAPNVAPYPRVESVSPAGGIAEPGVGQISTITAAFRDSTDGNNLLAAQILGNFAVDGRNACYITWARGTQGLQNSSFNLVYDDGSSYYSLAPLSPGSMENSQCRVVGSGSFVSVNGQFLTVTVAVVFKQSFAGRRGLWAAAQSSGGGNTNWQPVASREILPPKVWTQVSMPTRRTFLEGTTPTPDQPALPSRTSPAYVTIPGVGNPSDTGGAYVPGCFYPGSSPLWFDGGSSVPWIKPGLAKVTGPAAYLETNYITSSDAFTGIEVSGSFDGTADVGDASIFYSETNCHAGEREYGVRYNYGNGSLQLYWSSRTNCALSPIICWNHPTERSVPANAVTESSAAFVVNTSNLFPAGPIDRSAEWIYQIYFSRGRVYGAILNPDTFVPVPNAFVLQPGQEYTPWGVTALSSDWFPAPTANSNFGAGHISATIVPPIISPISPVDNSSQVARMRVNFVKAAR